MEGAGALFIVERAAEGPLGAFPAQHLVGRWAEPAFPLRIAEGPLGIARVGGSLSGAPPQQRAQQGREAGQNAAARHGQGENRIRA